jgi:structural maintenance of chromosomes protein 5
LTISDPAALRNHERRCAEIRQSEAEVAQLNTKRAAVRASIDTNKALWLPKLRDIVTTINATFGDNFAAVGTAGEVMLHEAEDEDFARYAIEIRVKFRESELLQTLDANRQSGGERSVSTIIFLVALQGVTVTPFRVVDEINQGMDPVNERKVFRQLVRASTGEATPQCFLLTPKLLPDLPFSKEVTVLQIMNGPHVGAVADGFTMERLYGSARPVAAH